MTRVLILGASSWIAQKLIHSLIQNGTLGDHRVTHLILADVNEPDMPADESNQISVKALQVDMTDPSHVNAMLEDMPQFIFHLTALSDAIDMDVELGYAVILEGLLTMLDRIRKQSDYTPRLVFASGMDGYRPFPPSGNSYATHKAIEELLEDSTRKGVLTAASLRLPILLIRPGPPDDYSAFSFLSDLLREPLHGRDILLSVSKDTMFTVASWHAAVEGLLHTALYEAVLPGDRVLRMHGLTLTIQEIINTLERHAPRLIEMEIGESSHSLDEDRARELGFASDESLEAILIQYAKEEGLSLT